MLTELLGLAGSGALGACFGLISDHLQRKADIEIAREESRATITKTHIAANGANPWFGAAFLVVVVCYCLACLICIYWPDVPLATFNPDDEAKQISILWGFFNIDRTGQQVFEITSGGVGYGLLHPLAFAICSVLTGLSPMRRK